MSDDARAADATQRVDKWLWVARFFKTRSSAAAAVSGGKVHVDGERVKPARRVGAGARLEIRRDEIAWDVIVVDVASRRLPAREAVALYQETEESVARREAEARRRRERAAMRAPGLGRPTKRDRRDLDRLRGSSDG